MSTNQAGFILVDNYSCMAILTAYRSMQLIAAITIARGSKG
jgi:hypothetical protein